MYRALIITSLINSIIKRNCQPGQDINIKRGPICIVPPSSITQELLLLSSCWWNDEAPLKCWWCRLKVPLLKQAEMEGVREYHRHLHKNCDCCRIDWCFCCCCCAVGGCPNWDRTCPYCDCCNCHRRRGAGRPMREKMKAVPCPRWWSDAKYLR